MSSENRKYRSFPIYAFYDAVAAEAAHARQAAGPADARHEHRHPRTPQQGGQRAAGHGWRCREHGKIATIDPRPGQVGSRTAVSATPTGSSLAEKGSVPF